MLLPCRFGVGLFVALALAAGDHAAWAQNPKPGSGEAKPADVKITIAPPEDSGVKVVLEAKPTTPIDLARSAKTLADLQRADLAKPLLKKLLDAKLDQKQMAALEEQLGSALFVSLGTRADLAPEGKQVADAVLAATQNELVDPQRLAGLVRQLQAPSEEARYRAFDGLRRARSAAVGPLVAVLADPGRAVEYPTVRAMLGELGADAVEPLLSVVQSPDPKLLSEVIPLLAELNLRQAVPFLLAPCTSEQAVPEVRKAASAALAKLVGHTPSKDEAARLLTEQAKNYLEQRQTFKADVDGRVELWSWDAVAKQPAVQRFPLADASRLLAVRFAREAYAVKPDDLGIRRLYLTTLLEKAAYDSGLSKPLPTDDGSPAAVAAGFDVKAIEDILAYAMETGHAPAATAAVRILGVKGTADGLLLAGAQPSPLVRALRHPDRRLRFAALEAIFKLKPARPFAGSSYVTDALGYFIATDGSRRALVADLAREDARKTAGLLISLGYYVDTAVSAQELMRQAIASPDYEVVLVAASLGERTIETTLQQLRFDNRTGWLPVGVVARQGQATLAAHIVRNDRWSMSFLRPHTEEDARYQVEQLLARLGPLHVPFEERQAQAAQAIVWISELSGQEKSVFGVRRLEELVQAAYRVPTLATQAVTILGNLSTPRCQKMLVDQASQVEQPLDARKAALAAFQQSVTKHGVLLTSQEILMQYDRYNQSEKLDRDTQQVLGAILDSIEARSKGETGNPKAEVRNKPKTPKAE